MALGVLAVALVGCSTDIPVQTLCEGFTLQVDELQTSRNPVRLDFLWVVDNSTSMCQEQASLTANINEFVGTLEAFANVDIRTAVVTTNAIEEHWRGRFNNSAAEVFPPFCQERRLFPARSDLFCECAACGDWDRAFEYQRCYDSDDCTPTTDMAPRYVACLNQGRCLDEAGNRDACAQAWVRDASPNLQRMYNKNGSVNVSCKIECGGAGVGVEQAHLFCRDCMADTSMECQITTPGMAAGCIMPPDTIGCPDDLPLVLPSYDEDGNVEYDLAEYFRCIATVGADQEHRSTMLEQGFKNAWLALDPNGPAPTQVCNPRDPVLDNPEWSPQQKRERCERVFLRDNAFLIIIFISDDEECSVDDGKEVMPEDYNRCNLLGDSDMRPEDVWIHPNDKNPNTSDRPLAPVYKFVNRFRSLKSNPANVFVATISGDAWHPLRELSEEEKRAERLAFYESITERGNPYRWNTYVCASAFGEAALGSRYLELVERFGPNGFHANICSQDGFGQALEQIAKDLVSQVISICLPRPPRIIDGQEAITVYKTGEDEERRRLEQGVDFVIVDELEQDACPGSGRAIQFSAESLPLPDDIIQILYEAEAVCGF